MKYRLTESAKTKYQWAFVIVTYVGTLAVFVLQGMGAM